MRGAVVAFGVVLAVFGCIWALQGFGLFPGESFMNNNATWAVIGPITAVVGVAITVFAWRGRK